MKGIYSPITAYGYQILFSRFESERTTGNLREREIRIEPDTALFDAGDIRRIARRYPNQQERTVFLGSDRGHRSTRTGQRWLYEVEGVVRFGWESGSRKIVYMPLEHFTERLLRYWALHMVVPIFLAIEGACNFLHAGAVEIAGQTVAFLAESFGGKSTMTDYFLRQGHPLITDDKLAVVERDGIFYGVPSYPWHRPYRRLEDLGLPVDNFAETPKPLRRLYSLDRREPDAPVGIERLEGVEKFAVLGSAAEFTLSFLKPEQFTFTTRLAKELELYRVATPWRLLPLTSL